MGSKSGIVNHYNVDKYRYFNSFTYTVSSGSLFYLWYQNNRNKYLADEKDGIPIKAVSDYFYENLQLKAFFSDLYSNAEDYFENHAIVKKMEYLHGLHKYSAEVVQAELERDEIF